MFHLNACPSAAAVHLNPHLQHAAMVLRRLGHGLRLRNAVHRQDQAVHLSGEDAGPAQLLRAHQGIGNKNIPQAARRHDFCFGNFAAGDANRPGLQLELGEVRHFVGFDVGAQRAARRSRGLLHLPDIAPGQLLIHHQAGSIKKIVRRLCHVKSSFYFNGTGSVSQQFPPGEDRSGEPGRRPGPSSNR